MRSGFAVERRSSVKDAVDAVAAAAQPKSATTQSQVAATGARALAREMSVKPPVDHERVQQIKRAIAEGRFPIVPARIADRLIAAQMEWVRSDEQAG
nr:flagellar biosynthesis anti-sigma factor FlgM [Sphingomonas jejuensis]